VLNSRVRSASGRRRKHRAHVSSLRAGPRGMGRSIKSRIRSRVGSPTGLDGDRPWDAYLDELLMETFPASDPLPFGYTRP